MSNFKQRKISRKPPKQPVSQKTKNNIAALVGLILLILLVYYGGLRLINGISGSRLFGLLSRVFASDLESDQRGRTNVLLLGVGGVGHEGENLTDTIMVASLDNENDSVSFISIPRDLFVKTKISQSRINELYPYAKSMWDGERALAIMQETVGSILGIPIHYSYKVDFKAFERIIDAIGGVDFLVEEAINDPFYPKEGTFDYEPFYLEKGFQHMDGKTALKFVRSRKTSSDFDRSKRQQQMLIAIKDKVERQKSYSRKSLIKQLYYSLTEHVDTNMSLREMLALAEFAFQLDTANISSGNLNDNPYVKGGFLYTPDRNLYSGAFVLVAASEKFDAIHTFVELLFYGPENVDSTPLAVLNGTKKNGLASRMKTNLTRLGLDVSATGNARQQNFQQTTWFLSDPTARPLLEFLNENVMESQISTEVPAEYKTNPDFSDVKIILELGEDAVSPVNALDVFRNVVFAPVGTSSTQQGSSTGQNTNTGSTSSL